ncbi:MAG: N-acetyltransferase family protein [Chloroflexota bacterium]
MLVPTVVPMTPNHWEAVRAIYEAGIATGRATFETAAPDWNTWDHHHRQDCRLVAVRGDQVIGWAALTPVSSRQVYCGVAELSVYVAPDARRQGVGRMLLSEMVTCSEANGVWMLQATVFPENEASLFLHQAVGFRVVGRREHIACLHGQWRDTLLLERRSTVIGG